RDAPSPRSQVSSPTYRRCRSPAPSCPRPYAQHRRGHVPDFYASLSSPTSARALEHGGLGADHTQEIVPRLDEGLGAIVLKLLRERGDIDLRGGEARKHRLGVAAVR